MNRRQFLAAAAAAPLAAPAGTASVRLGIDLFSLRSQNWTPFESLDYCARRHVQVVHFSEIRFLGSLEKTHLEKVRQRAAQLGIAIEIGMRSICPSSKMFDASAGTAEAQLSRMIDAATVIGSPIVRCVLGSMDDRLPGPIEKHMEDTAAVLRAVRAQALDARVKVAIENHAGDMQAGQLKTLIEEAGADFTGVCLDAGNPLWTLEDPHFTLETLHPYVLTSHVRDTAVWNLPEGVAVTWVRMGEGNVGIDSYLRKYVELCPGRAVSLESIVFGPRVFAWRKPDFWKAYPDVRASGFSRFLQIAESGKPAPAYAWERGKDLEREDLEASLAYLRRLFA